MRLEHLQTFVPRVHAPLRRCLFHVDLAEPRRQRQQHARRRSAQRAGNEGTPALPEIHAQHRQQRQQRTARIGQIDAVDQHAGHRQPEQPAQPHPAAAAAEIGRHRNAGHEQHAKIVGVVENTDVLDARPLRQFDAGPADPVPLLVDAVDGQHCRAQREHRHGLENAAAAVQSVGEHDKGQYHRREFFQLFQRATEPAVEDVRHHQYGKEHQQQRILRRIEMLARRQQPETRRHDQHDGLQRQADAVGQRRIILRTDQHQQQVAHHRDEHARLSRPARATDGRRLPAAPACLRTSRHPCCARRESAASRSATPAAAFPARRDSCTPCDSRPRAP